MKAKTGTAWSRGDGGMEGPAGWNSGFGRAGFAAAGKTPNARRGDTPIKPIEQPATPTPSSADARPTPGAPTDPWDRPYGDASWGGQAVRRTPNEERRAILAARAGRKPPQRRT